MSTKIDIDLFPKQVECFQYLEDDSTTEILFGGGAGGSNTGTTGSTGGAGNVPSTSPIQGYRGGNVTVSNGYGVGGGGSGSNGVDGANTSGGNGTANSITGSSTIYAYGGDGKSGAGQDAGNGKGLGGSGAGQQNTSGAGGTGVVILSMPDADYSGTTTGSPGVATGVSGKTVLTFTGDGSYTK